MPSRALQTACQVSVGPPSGVGMIQGGTFGRYTVLRRLQRLTAVVGARAGATSVRRSTAFGGAGHHPNGRPAKATRNEAHGRESAA